MTEREPNPALGDLLRQAGEVAGLHPGISVSREESGWLCVFEGPDDPELPPVRSIQMHPVWSAPEQRVPDLVLDVRDGQTGMLITTLVSRFDGTKFTELDQVHAAKVDTSEIVEAGLKGVELFEAYTNLPRSARNLIPGVPGLKVNDQVREVEDLIDVYEKAGSSMVAGWLVEDGVQYMSPGQCFHFIRYALQDIYPAATEYP